MAENSLTSLNMGFSDLLSSSWGCIVKGLKRRNEGGPRSGRYPRAEAALPSVVPQSGA